MRLYLLVLVHQLYSRCYCLLSQNGSELVEGWRSNGSLDSTTRICCESPLTTGSWGQRLSPQWKTAVLDLGAEREARVTKKLNVTKGELSRANPFGKEPEPRFKAKNFPDSVETTRKNVGILCNGSSSTRQSHSSVQSTPVLYTERSALQASHKNLERATDKKGFSSSEVSIEKHLKRPKENSSETVPSILPRNITNNRLPSPIEETTPISFTLKNLIDSNEKLTPLQALAIKPTNFSLKAEKSVDEFSSAISYFSNLSSCIDEAKTLCYNINTPNDANIMNGKSSFLDTSGKLYIVQYFSDNNNDQDKADRISTSPTNAMFIHRRLGNKTVLTGSVGTIINLLEPTEGSQQSLVCDGLVKATSSTNYEGEVELSSIVSLANDIQEHSATYQSLNETTNRDERVNPCSNYEESFESEQDDFGTHNAGSLENNEEGINDLVALRTFKYLIEGMDLEEALDKARSGMRWSKNVPVFRSIWPFGKKESQSWKTPWRAESEHPTSTEMTVPLISPPPWPGKTTTVLPTDPSRTVDTDVFDSMLVSWTTRTSNTTGPYPDPIECRLAANTRKESPHLQTNNPIVSK